MTRKEWKNLSAEKRLPNEKVCSHINDVKQWKVKKYSKCVRIFDQGDIHKMEGYKTTKKKHFEVSQPITTSNVSCRYESDDKDIEEERECWL